MVGGGTNSYVSALAVYDSMLYVGGDFSITGSISANNIAAWNGNAWSTLGNGVDSTVNALFVYDSDLYVGGNFITADGDTVNHIARWSNDPVSAKEIKNAELKIYPNPANNIITITGINTKTTIKIFDVLGNLVFASSLNNSQSSTLDISQLSNGVYMLVTETSDKKACKKLVINK